MHAERTPVVPDDVQEACGQLLDLWKGVRGFRGLYPHRYPTGGWALWMELESENVAAPDSWMAVPVVVIVGREVHDG